MSDADIGTPVRYRGLGAGVVIDHKQREFRGVHRTFAVIKFPHRDMTAQVPLGDEAVESKLCSVDDAHIVQALIDSISEAGGRLQRTWEEREKTATRRLRDGGPSDWANLLRDYAAWQRSGQALAVSDVEVIREAQVLLAAEYACASGTEYPPVIEKLRLDYGRAAVAELADLAAA